MKYSLAFGAFLVVVVVFFKILVEKCLIVSSVAFLFEVKCFQT